MVPLGGRDLVARLAIEINARAAAARMTWQALCRLCFGALIRSGWSRMLAMETVAWIRA
jgi:hypothetical protein